MKKAGRIIGWLIVLLLVFGSRAGAYSLTIMWKPNKTDPDLKGYRVYYGTESRNYFASFDAENVTEYTLNGILPGQTYYVTVTAYDIAGNESDPFQGEEIFYGTDAAPLDTDGDGFSDATELAEGTNPLDRVSVPVVTTIKFNVAAGTVVFPMRRDFYEAAWPRPYIYVPDQVLGIILNPYSSEGGYLQFYFEVPKEGDYALFGEGLGDSAGNNSFWFAITDQESNYQRGFYRWDMTLSTGWLWEKMTDAGNPRTFHLLPGVVYTLTIPTREDGAKLTKLILANNMRYTPSELAPYYVERKAEEGVVQLKMRLAQDVEKGWFVHTPDQLFGKNSDPDSLFVGFAEYQVTVNEEGYYVIMVDSWGSSGGNNSFWVKFAGAVFQWEMPITQYWAWDSVSYEGSNPAIFHLLPGDYTIKFVPREDGAKIAAFRVFKLDYVP